MLRPAEQSLLTNLPVEWITSNLTVQRVVINQPGVRPGQPGSQITVPLSNLQALQPGQGNPTKERRVLVRERETLVWLQLYLKRRKQERRVTVPQHHHPGWSVSKISETLATSTVLFSASVTLI
jgi:hypothetical protein